MMMFEPKRIHPVGMILNLIKAIKSYIASFIVLFFVGGNIDFNIYFFLGIVAIFAFMLLSSFLEWLKFKYWIEDGEFRIEHGVFVKKKRYIPIERIQSINIRAGIIQQIFRLVKVQIETASGGIEAEAVLTAIKKEDVHTIEQAISIYKNGATLSQDDDEKEIELPTYKISKKELLIAASTSSGVGVILSAIAAFISQFDEIIPYEKIYDQFDFLANASFTIYAILIFIAFVITWILSVIGVLLKYAYFTVTKDEKEIKISKGIFEKQQVSIPISRIQAIRIVQNPLRELLGYSTIYIESAGGSASDQGLSTVLFPVVNRKDVQTLLAQYLPSFTNEQTVYPLPKKSLQRYLFRKLLPAVVICIPLIIVYLQWGLLSIVLLPISYYWGYLAFKNAGWVINDNRLQLSFRVISKTTVLIQRNKIQSMKSKTSYFQRRNGLQTISVTIKTGVLGKSFVVKDLDERDADSIVDWYSYS